MIRIDKIRFHGTEVLYNRFFVYSQGLQYVVRRPKNERTLESVEKIMNCKTEKDLFSIGGCPAPKGGKFSLEEYLISKGLN